MQRRLLVVVLGVSVEGGLALLAVALGLMLGQPALEHFRWDATDAVLGAAASLPPLAIFLLLERWPVGAVARIKQFLDEYVRPLFATSSVLDLAIISLIAGWGEELLFRGVLQAAGIRWFGPWIGVAAGSLLFGLAHSITLLYAVWAGLIGVYLGWLLLASDNLLVVIVAHALYDFVALCYLVRRR